MNPIIIIPARMASTRLPNKPLVDIAGLPMIIHVMNRAKEADIAPAYIACAEDEIYQMVVKHGGNAVMTDPDLPSGTDRIHQALQEIDPENQYDIIINVQGDEPTLDPKTIEKSLAPFKNDGVDITTLATLIKSSADKRDPNIVKAIVAWNEDSTQGKALYFTRATAPYGKGELYQHIGLYAYRRSALERFTSLPPSPLEQVEKLEQLRALEDDMHIEVIAIEEKALGVDTPQDLEKARAILGGA